MSAAKIAGHATCIISKEFVIELILDIGEILIKVTGKNTVARFWSCTADLK